MTQTIGVILKGAFLGSIYKEMVDNFFMNLKSAKTLYSGKCNEKVKKRARRKFCVRKNDLRCIKTTQHASR